MKTGTRILIRTAVAALLACALVPSAGARTVKQKKQAARTQFETAERMREALNGTPESKRTRSDYQKVIEAYRKVYYTAPNSNKADAAVLAVAELLDEQGRVLNDTKSYKDAIGQLVFLRREYPGSKYRVEALFTIAEIYRDDLQDNVQAKTAFEDYLKHYPQSSLAPKARQALADIGNAQAGGNPFKKKPAKPQTTTVKTKAAWAETASAKPVEETPPTDLAKNTSERSSKPAQEKPQTAEARDVADLAVKDPSAAALQEPVNAAIGKADTQAPHRMARLTSVRHWSTPDYTRVAIDLEQEVQYQVGRVPHPDRIFFDLYGTRLASDLVGKSFDVEAGFLHRIRVAQYKTGVARVVLDVDDVAEYSAFLLPNPYRLIIDIHGKLPPQKTATAKPQPQSAPAKSTDTEPVSDVTVTQIKPPANSKSSEKVAAAPQTDKTTPKPAASVTAKPAESTAKSRSTSERTVEMAKADPPKIVVDDTAMDNPSNLSSKPTSGPTFQAIAPQESSRNKRKKKTPEPAKTAASARTAAPTHNGDRSLIRALGLKIGKIVVDAGHGGHDTGTIGPNGLMEKDLVLDVALKLGKLLEDRLGAEVIYTRDDDTFVPLETRTAIANKEQADMFISIHANSSDDASARGVETYYLNFTSSRDALEVAARENAVSEKSIHELQDLVKKIALKEKIEESREFATDVQRSLYTGLNARNPGIRNRGVKKAPFIVLIGANMPSILAEVSFVSNPGDERKLKTSEYRQRIAESLYKGVNKYVSGLSGVKTASKLENRGSGVGPAAVAAR
ncbi:MAG TPA: N-acetylmuramoyl-L-alanine amidase [Candidatus Angelobacter sp.]|nr:N-acetylmuramoyl-L-alanine amidase [Candidatus Angelobacter sp.]